MLQLSRSLRAYLPLTYLVRRMAIQTHLHSPVQVSLRSRYGRRRGHVEYVVMAATGGTLQLMSFAAFVAFFHRHETEYCSNSDDPVYCKSHPTGYFSRQYKMHPCRLSVGWDRERYQACRDGTCVATTGKANCVCGGPSVTKLCGRSAHCVLRWCSLHWKYLLLRLWVCTLAEHRSDLNCGVR
jgi:hypothetical protein